MNEITGTDDVLWIDLAPMDWGLLRKQKRAFADILFRRRKPSSMECDLLEGILNILDAIQDQAAKDLGEKAVFKAKMPTMREALKQ